MTDVNGHRVENNMSRTGVRWYLAYSLSHRHLKDRLAVRDVLVSTDCQRPFLTLRLEVVKMNTRCRRMAFWVAFSVAGALTLGACAQTRGYQPLANPQTDPRAASYNQDLEYCKGQASQTAQTGTQAAQGALAGGAAGAAGGAITGSLSKNVPMGKGAAVGGALGALAGGAYGAYQGDQQYQTALWGCMHQLGHPVGY